MQVRRTRGPSRSAVSVPSPEPGFGARQGRERVRGAEPAAWSPPRPPLQLRPRRAADPAPGLFLGAFRGAPGEAEEGPFPGPAGVGGRRTREVRGPPAEGLGNAAAQAGRGPACASLRERKRSAGRRDLAAEPRSAFGEGSVARAKLAFPVRKPDGAPRGGGARRGALGTAPRGPASLARSRPYGG